MTHAGGVVAFVHLSGCISLEVLCPGCGHKVWEGMAVALQDAQHLFTRRSGHCGGPSCLSEHLASMLHVLGPLQIVHF